MEKAPAVAASPENTSPALSPERLTEFLDKVSASVRSFGIEKGVRREESVDFIKSHFGYFITITQREPRKPY